jgi:AcrR family transcriptional regulator
MSDRPRTGLVAAAGVLAPPTSGSRSKDVTREVVVAEALTIVDLEGLGALTMRRLASNLGVGVATVYAVITSKEVLFQELADAVITEVPLRGEAASATEALVEYFLATHEMLQRHPAVAQLSAMKPVLSERAFRMQERILELLRAGGLDARSAAGAYSTLGSYVLGFTLTGISRLDRERHAKVAQLPADQFPQLHAAAPYFATQATDEGQFEDGLRIILAGLFPADHVSRGDVGGHPAE